MNIENKKATLAIKSEKEQMSYQHGDIDTKRKAKTGIDVEEELKRKKHKITIDGKEIEISDGSYNNLKRSINENENYIF